jgi:hypothetical protein
LEGGERGRAPPPSSGITSHRVENEPHAARQLAKVGPQNARRRVDARGVRGRRVCGRLCRGRAPHAQQAGDE